jgi:hypothetical protein
MSALLLPPRQSVGQVAFADDFEVTCPAAPCTGILAGNCLPMWFTSHGTPEVRLDLSTGNRSLCLAYNGFSNGEGAFRTLSIGEQFLPCQLYTISFRIRTLDMTMPGNARYQIALTNVQFDFNNMFCIDDLNVTLTGPVPQASVTATVQPEPACQGESVEIRYQICNAVGLNATTYTLQAGPLPTGITLAPGSANPASGTIAGGTCVANSNCTELIFQFVTAPNQSPGSYTIPLTVSVQSQHNCIQGWNDEVKFDVDNCAFSCPCEDPDVVNTNINADDYGTSGEVLLSQLIADGTLLPGSVSNRCIAIRGTLRINIQGEYTIEDCEMRMQPGSGIVIGHSAKLNLDIVTRNGGISGCTQMWKGIRVEDNAKLKSKNSNIADAQYAVWADDNSELEILGSEFRRNYTGVYFHPPLPGEFFMPIFYGNLFDGAQPLLPPFAGQTPPPGAHPFVGVDVTGQSLLHIGTAGTGPPNTFRALRNGILTDNTQAIIENSIFEDILRVNTEPNYPFTGFAVRHKGGAAHGLTIQGLGQNVPWTFRNCTFGVWASGTNVQVTDAFMAGMPRGIEVQMAQSRKLNILDNRISASGRGIVLQHNDPAATLRVAHNIITVNSENSGFFFALPAHGIAVLEHGIPHLTEAVIEDNLITAFGAADNGMWMQAADHYRIENNTIGLSAQPDTELEHAGILLEGVRHSQVLNNTIEGNSTNNGIGMDVFGSSDVFYDCNTLSNLHTGARFGGVCNGTELQATTFITPMRIGLHYLPGLTTDPQLHEGNQWLTTGGAFGEAAARNDIQNVQGVPIDVALAAQRYEVHSTAPPFYPPSFSFPGLPPPGSTYVPFWFPIDEEGAPDPCGAEPDMLVGGVEEMRIRIAQGISFEDDYAANRLWQARRNIYDAIAAEAGSLSGAVQSFYQSNSAGLLGSLHAVEQGKRELFRLLPAARAQMDIHLADMKQLAEDIAEQDSLLALEEGNLMLRQSLLQEFGMAVRAVDSLEQAIYAARTALADSLQISNSLLTANAIYESNAIQVNDLYLDKPARGLADFTEAQLATLDAIAEQCPAAGGRAVWQARSLLALASVHQDYPDSCLPNWPALQMPGYPAVESIVSSGKYNLDVKLNIFPNPAQDVITVRFLPDVAQYMQLADVMGHIRWSLDVSIGTGDSGEVSIDVSRLASEYYYFLLRDINGLIHSRSISIIH